MDIKKKFGRRLRELRLNKALTQEKISESIGIQPENYSKLENGFSFPKPENLEKIAKVLDVNLQELFEFEHLDNNAEIVSRITAKINSDDNAAIMTYKFLKSIGKL